MTDRIVVVGGGIATVRLVESLRRFGSTAELVVVAGEAHQPYDRPPLSKTVLQGDASEPPSLRTADDYAGWGVDLRLGRRAAELRPGSATVLLDDGTELAYDRLVVATGAEPRRLPALSARGDTHLLRTFDDAVRLRAAMRAGGQLVIVGAGFIGCEVAASARSVGVEVTLVDVLTAPLVRVLGERVAAEIARMHVVAGVDLRMRTSVTDVADGKAQLSDGDTIGAAVVLVAIGVVPATAWLTGSGIAVDDGVRCDASGRTSAANVWAMGDVASWLDPLTGRHRRYEHWTSAGDQAVVIARNLTDAEGPRTLTDVPYFWSDQYGVKLQSLGSPAGDDDVELLAVGPHARPLAVYGRDGVVTGVVGFAVPRQVMRMRSLLATRASYDDALSAARAEG